MWSGGGLILRDQGPKKKTNTQAYMTDELESRQMPWCWRIFGMREERWTRPGRPTVLFQCGIRTCVMRKVPGRHVVGKGTGGRWPTTWRKVLKPARKSGARVFAATSEKQSLWRLNTLSGQAIVDCGASDNVVGIKALGTYLTN